MADRHPTSGSAKRPARDTSLAWHQARAAAARWAMSIATVVGLSVVGWYGHATHWTFGMADHGGHHEADHETHAPAEGAATADVIRFDSQESLVRTGIEVVPVEAGSMVSEVIANGVVRYDGRRVAQLSTRVPGTVWRVERHLGDSVKAGDVLLVVESSEVGRLKAEFLNALVAFEARREQLAILEEVKSAVMGRQLREARAALREARNHLQNAEQALVNLGFEISITDFEPLDDEARAARIRTLGLEPRLVAGLDPDRVTSNLLPLRTPFDGIVIGREAVVGEVVEAGKQIFEVADVSRMWIVLSVSKEDAARVKVGQPLRFRPDGSTTDVLGTVAWISTEVNEETRTLEVRADVAGEVARSLRANIFGTGLIEVERQDTAMVVPAASVQWDGARWVVFVPAGEAAFAPLPVTPGLRQGDRVAISGEFAVGQPTHVVAQGSHLLKSKILLDRLEGE